MENTYDELSWERNSYWSYYPDNHLSSRKGIEPLYSNIQNTYRNRPNKDWNQDTKSFYYGGTDNELSKQLTNISKSTKENIKKFQLLKNKREMISIYSNGDASARLSMVEDKLYLHANNLIDYIDLSWGNFQRDIVLDKEYSNEIVIKINTHSNKSNRCTTP